jgi:hypothetical protein
MRFQLNLKLHHCKLATMMPRRVAIMCTVQNHNRYGKMSAASTCLRTAILMRTVRALYITF